VCSRAGLTDDRLDLALGLITHPTVFLMHAWMSQLFEMHSRNIKLNLRPKSERQSRLGPLKVIAAISSPLPPGSFSSQFQLYSSHPWAQCVLRFQQDSKSFHCTHTVISGCSISVGGAGFFLLIQAAEPMTAFLGLV